MSGPRSRLYALLAVGDVRKAEAALKAFFEAACDEDRTFDPGEAVGVVVDALADSFNEREILQRLWPEGGARL